MTTTNPPWKRLDWNLIASIRIPAPRGSWISIEERIRNATICLADISTDNPNVWYELGYAFAVRRSVIMVCSKERGGRFPFDIRDRTIIEYASDSRSDFDKLRNEISKRAKALVKKIAEQPVIEVQPVTPTEGLETRTRFRYSELWPTRRRLQLLGQVFSPCVAGLCAKV